MDKIKKNDFIEVEYTGSLKDSGEVFDTTSEQEAKKAGIHNPKMTYGPMVVCVGEAQLLKGLDEQVEGKSIGSHNIDITAEKAFGKRDPKSLKIIPPKAFAQQQIRPMPGLRVNIDNSIGIVKAVAGGRVIVDFNHPLSGKDVIYKIKINRIVTDDAEKVASFLSLTLNLKKELFNIDAKDGSVEIKMKAKLPEEISKLLTDDIKRITGINSRFTEDKVESKA